MTLVYIAVGIWALVNGVGLLIGLYCRFMRFVDRKLFERKATRLQRDIARAEWDLAAARERNLREHIEEST